jgi:dodecin
VLLRSNCRPAGGIQTTSEKVAATPSPPAPPKEVNMPASTDKDHVYKILELVGSSDKSIEAAIENAVSRASKTVREMKWFEVVQTRGHIEDGKVRHYQVALRVGFTLE